MIIPGALYDVVGFEWSTLFTVGWNAVVFVAALNGLLAVGIIRFNNNAREQSMYAPIEGDVFKKEVDKFGGKPVHFMESDSYQSV